MEKQTQQALIPNLCTVQATFILVLIAELIVIVLTLSSSQLPRFNWESLSLASTLALWITLTSAAVLCYFRDTLNQLTLIKAASISFSLIVLIGGFFCHIGEWVIYLTSGHQYLPLSFLDSIQHWNLWRAFNNTLIVAIVSGISLRYFYVQEQLRQQKQAELEARLAALQARIRPHFLFNSLNSVASLIAIDAHKAEDMVLHLCDLFRAALSDSDTPHSLEKELELCRSYLLIEEIRLGDRLKLDWDVDFSQLPPQTIPTVPKLLVQPLVENAVYHGIQPLPEGGTINLKVALSEKQVTVTISNPLPKVSPDVPQGHQVALNNVRARLSASYGTNANIAVTADQQYTVVLVLPVQTESLAKM